MKINSVYIPFNAKIYLCGPTVYQNIHIGNLRSILIADIIYRMLPEAIFVRNITDIDDKIIDKTNNIEDMRKFTEDIIRQFHIDLDNIGIKKPSYEPRASDYINEMIELIKILIDKKYAYISQDHVLFDTARYKEYGLLFKKNIEETKSNIRKEIDCTMKKNINDFVLWKPDNMFYDSPWGKGRPGWHIECSAMIHSIFKSNIDLHCGGSDLIFPHHENENAQSCCALNYKYISKAWLHNSMLTVDNIKMSKSKNNIILVKDILSIYNATTIRIALLNTIYYKTLNWNDRLIKQSIKIANKIYRFLSSTKNIDQYSYKSSKIIDALNDNLNIPLAISLIQNKIDENNNIDEIITALNVLGIIDTYKIDIGKINISYINEQYKQYIKYRREKNYIESDKIRNNLPNIEMNDNTWNIIDHVQYID